MFLKFSPWACGCVWQSHPTTELSEKESRGKGERKEWGVYYFVFLKTSWWFGISTVHPFEDSPFMAHMGQWSLVWDRIRSIPEAQGVLMQWSSPLHKNPFPVSLSSSTALADVTNSSLLLSLPCHLPLLYPRKPALFRSLGLSHQNVC